MFEQFVDPFLWHNKAPLSVLEVLLLATLVAQLTGLLDHVLYLVGVERVEDLEEEVALR